MPQRYFALGLILFSFFIPTKDSRSDIIQLPLIKVGKLSDKIDDPIDVIPPIPPKHLQQYSKHQISVDLRQIPILRSKLPLSNWIYLVKTRQERKDIECLAWNIYFEARGSHINEKIAVGYVPINRLGKKDFGSTICDNVFQYTLSHGRKKYQFSWVAMHINRSWKPDIKTWHEIENLAVKIYERNIRDTGNGATYFQARKHSVIWNNRSIKQHIGQSVFWKG